MKSSNTILNTLLNFWNQNTDTIITLIGIIIGIITSILIILIPHLIKKTKINNLIKEQTKNNKDDLKQYVQSLKDTDKLKKTNINSNDINATSYSIEIMRNIFEKNLNSIELKEKLEIYKDNITKLLEIHHFYIKKKVKKKLKENITDINKSLCILDETEPNNTFEKYLRRDIKGINQDVENMKTLKSNLINITKN